MTRIMSAYVPVAGKEPLRLAVIGTPRSGNTWVRMQLAALFGLEQLAAHRPEEIDWANLPARSVIQIHWLPYTEFLDDLARAGIRPVVLARDPFDVLISWLNHMFYTHIEFRCPGAGGCPECEIFGETPSSPGFVRYAQSEYAEMLLGFSPAWWDRPGVIRARYEELVASPEAEVGELARQVGEPPERAVAEVVAEHAMEGMRKHSQVWRFQCWKGQPGHWRRYFTSDAARAIYEKHAEVFRVLGYGCEPDPNLTPLQAELNWTQVQLQATREHLIRERGRYIKTCQERDFLAAQVRRLDARDPVQVCRRVWHSTGLPRLLRRGTRWATDVASPGVPAPHVAPARVKAAEAEAKA